MFSTLNSRLKLWTPVPRASSGWKEPQTISQMAIHTEAPGESLRTPLYYPELLKAKQLAVNDKQFPSPHGGVSFFPDRMIINRFVYSVHILVAFFNSRVFIFIF